MVNLKDINTFRPKHKWKKTGLDRERKTFLILMADKKLKKEYKIFGRFRGIKKVNKFKHKICGTIFPLKAYKLLDGVGCPVCARIKSKERQELFIQVLQDLNVTDLHIPIISDDVFIIGIALMDDLRIELAFDGRLKFLSDETDKPFRKEGYFIDNYNRQSLSRVIRRHHQNLIIRKKRIEHYERLIKRI